MLSRGLVPILFYFVTKNIAMGKQIAKEKKKLFKFSC